MKKHTEFDERERPLLWQEFDVDGTTVITVPDAMLECDRCVAQQMGGMPGVCHTLPICTRVTFVPKNAFDTPEMKVRLVKWRMGLNDDET